MKKLAVVLFALAFVASVCFAQGALEKTEPVKSVEKGVKNVGEFVGKVVSVTVAEPAKGITDGTVKVSDDMGNPVSFTVKSTAKVIDASLNVITLDQLKAGTKIKVESAKSKEGKEEAKSITVM